MKHFFKLLACGVLLMSFHVIGLAQCTYIEGQFQGPDCPNAIQTAVPYLTIIGDARSAGMGDVGVSSSPDNHSIFYNVAKLAEVEEKFGISLSYTPWLRNLVKDIYLVSASGFVKLDDLQSLGFGLRVFNMGEIQFVNDQGADQGTGKPIELDVSLGYARKLGEYFSMGVTGRFIYSDLASGQSVSGIEINAATAGAVDLAMYYDRELGNENNLSIGLALTNMGSKISYTESGAEDFLPANISLGGSYQIKIDDYNSLTVHAEFDKLMAPTPTDEDEDGNGIADFREKSVVSGIFGSFGDAETGEEEFKEINYGVGLEYIYQENFAFRTGYFHEASSKGNRQHLTVGLGLVYKVAKFDVSYLISTNGNVNPLNNTLRFTLGLSSELFKAEDVN